MHPFDAGSIAAEFTSLLCESLNLQPGKASKCFELEQQIASKEYTPDCCGVLIPQLNPDGTLKKNRGITPLNPSDWIVQRIFLRLLDSETDGTFSTAISYGRKAKLWELPRSPANCCITVGRSRRQFPSGVRADLVNFSPPVDRSTLLAILRRALLPEWKWDWLLKRLIVTDAKPYNKATDSEREKYWQRGKGVHQGTVLAPFFANVFMPDWDEYWHPRVPAFRYVDDWLVLGATLSQARKAATAMKHNLLPGDECHLDDE